VHGAAPGYHAARCGGAKRREALPLMDDSQYTSFGIDGNNVIPIPSRDDQAPSPVLPSEDRSQWPPPAEALRLIQAFVSIEDEKARSIVIAMIESYAKDLRASAQPVAG
jgi:hypothetical protein